MSDGNDAGTAQPALVEQLIIADEERRRLHQAGQHDFSTIEFSEQLTPEQCDELARMLECAEKLERLAALDAGDSWTTPVGDDRSPLDGTDDPASEEVHHIGNYRVLRLIADGGFGAVLLAVDERDNRRVALKVPRPDIRLTSRLQERFLIEGRAASTLNHPNIVSVYETLAEPVPAIVYEYCDGGTLSQAAKRIDSEATAIRIVLRLAEALQHAHTRGILHRDVKPGNVLLIRSPGDSHDNAIFIDGEWWIPKLGDFGLAKVVDDSVHQTQTGVVMGTPQFMAPEQAAGRVSELGTHTDVFSLGAIFYWLLVGQPPFDGKSTLPTLRMIETMEAEPPRRLRRNISPKTEAVCLKCLRKPIDARYPSAAALADDLRHLLNGEPVSVRPPRATERLREWGRRNPALAVFTIMFLLAAVLGMLIQWNNNRSLQEYVDRLDAANQNLMATTQQAEEARAHAERHGYASDLQLAQRSFDIGDVKTYTESLERYIPSMTRAADLRGPEWQELWDRGHPPSTSIDQFPSAIYCAKLSSDGTRLVACGADATIRVYETDTWQRAAIIESGQQEVNYASFSSDGSRIASAGDDGTIHIWDWQTGERLRRIEAYDDLVYSVQFYDNDTKLASCARNPVIRLWSVETGKLAGECAGAGDVHRVEQLDVSDNEQWVASASYDGRRRVWRLSDQKVILSAQPIDGQRTSSICFFERDGQDWLISGTLREGSRADCSVILEILAGSDQRVLPIHFDGIQSVAVDRNGQLAAAGDAGGRISMIDVNAAIRGKRWWYPETIRKSWVGHSGRVFGLAMLDDAQTVISAGEDGELTRWHTDQRTGWKSRSADLGRDRQFLQGAVLPGECAYLVDDGGEVHRWNLHDDVVSRIQLHDTNEPLRIEPREDRAVGSLVVWGDRVFAKSPDGPVCCWRVDEGAAELLWSTRIGDTTDDPTPGIYALTVSPDGTQLAICRRGHPVHNVVVDAATGTVLKKIPVAGGIAVGCRAIAYDTSGTQLAFGSERDVFVHNLQTGEQSQFSGHAGEIRQVRFVPDSNLLLSGANDRTICVWDLSTGQIVDQLTGHRSAIECVGLHPDRQRIISSDDLGWVRIWSLEDGLLLSELPPPSPQTCYVSCGADLVGISEGHTVFQKRLRSPRR